MPSFRAYPISKNHKVAATPSVIIICESERDGLQQAQQLVNEDDLELWDGPRFIARLKPRQEKGLKLGKRIFLRGALEAAHSARASHFVRVWVRFWTPL